MDREEREKDSKPKRDDGWGKWGKRGVKLPHRSASTVNRKVWFVKLTTANWTTV